MKEEKKSVTAKTACASWKAWTKVWVSLRSAATISTPLAEWVRDASLLGLRVMPRMRQPGSLRKVETTDEPWVPVAPTMAMSLVEDISGRWLG